MVERKSRMGLSPHAGTSNASLIDVRIMGSIPARAGESPLLHRTHSPRAKVYPRACGELTPATVAAALVKGLSARAGSTNQCALDLVWRTIPVHAGNLLPGPGGEDRPGSIPAGAGNLRCWVYPRVRGNHPQTASPHHGIGLSTRVQGYSRLPLLHYLAPGSIPACCRVTLHPSALKIYASCQRTGP